MFQTLLQRDIPCRDIPCPIAYLLLYEQARDEKSHRPLEKVDIKPTCVLGNSCLPFQALDFLKKKIASEKLDSLYSLKNLTRCTLLQLQLFFYSII